MIDDGELIFTMTEDYSNYSGKIILDKMYEVVNILHTFLFSLDVNISS